MPATPVTNVRFIVVMGVSGCGKTTIASLLASHLGWEFIDADSLHPPANVEKMSHGIPLTDADREPWLKEIARVLGGWRQAGKQGVIACSALRQRYRDLIRAGADDVVFVYLRGDRALIRQRLAARQGHYMPVSLLESQFAALEEPGPEEPAIAVDIDAPPQALAARILATLRLG